LTSDKHSPERLREMVDNNIKPELMRVNGVANVEVGGGRERKILVEFYQDRLEAYELSIRQVIDTIGKQNLNLLTGKREEGSSSISIRIGGTYKTMDDLRNLVVLRSSEGSSIRLGDVADVKDFYLEAQTYARLNKKPTVSVYVQKANDSNTIRVAERVRKVSDRLQTEVLGSEIKMDVITDQSVFISQAMNNVVQNPFFWDDFNLVGYFPFLKRMETHLGCLFVGSHRGVYDADRHALDRVYVERHDSFGVGVRDWPCCEQCDCCLGKRFGSETARFSA
jgi:multidrug efflux pump subunit AcrB